MTKFLSQHITLNRRYGRSVNLERDFENLEALEGYIPTERAINALKRIINGIVSSQGNRAWTVTSVYGTGKSAFAHFLVSLLKDSQNQLRIQALEIAKTTLGENSLDYQNLTQSLPQNGYIRAVATAQREPISHTLVRALTNGVETYWTSEQLKKIPVIGKLNNLQTTIKSGETINNQDIVTIAQELATASQSGIFIVIDELGKSLEYAAYNQGAEDLYLLQQLSESNKDNDYPVYIIGILHQAFTDYGHRLAAIQRNEWAKIQGRFEDIPFTESPSSMMRLIGEAIDKTNGEEIQFAIHNAASDWFKSLNKAIQGENLTQDILAAVYPLHPVSGLVLPTLCQRFAQNDRSLFTFLTSSEPFGLRSFLNETKIENEPFPTLKLDRIYDYFIESAGMGLASRPNLQRWVEIQDLISDSKRLDPDSLRVLKTIGILNLTTTTGSSRATRELVTLAMCDSPEERESTDYWSNIIDELLKKGIITHRRQLDELRIWQGSDFNVDNAVSLEMEKERGSLVELLTNLRPLNPLIAQRHSYKTGTLRYFERRYFDNTQKLESLKLENDDSDGLIGYWLDETIPSNIPASTSTEKPFLLVIGDKLELLRIRAREYAALQKIQTSYPELQSDGVARKEVRYRVTEAAQFLDDILNQAFDFSLNSHLCWVQGEKKTFDSVVDFNATLSDVCHSVYPKTPILWNELINRRVLTSQGSKARRELITAMIEHSDKAMLGLSGYGPEVAIYYSLLGETGIHRQVSEEEILEFQSSVADTLNSKIADDNLPTSETDNLSSDWGIYPPASSSKIYSFWEAVEDFCVNAYDKPCKLSELYEKLAQPPYGIKQGPIPVLIAAIILYHIDDIGIYQDGTFIPMLGAEHFELLVKDPSRFAVKYFEVVGLRSEVFKELESILRNPNLKKAKKLRNATLLTVVTPLYQFVKKLPNYTKQTKRLSQEALKVLKALQETVEPDELIFTQLPLACNLSPIGTEEVDESAIAKNLRNKLVQALREIHTAYEKLLSDCQSLLYEAFGIRSSETQLREDLRLRAKLLVGQCVERNLRSFVQAAIDEDKSDSEWLEALVMVIGDKPPTSWTDEEVTAFEIKLSDIARRFKNLEALQKDVAAKDDRRFEARRITVTRPDGQETHQMLWLDNSKDIEIDKRVQEILDIMPKDEPSRQAILAKLTEIILKSRYEN